MIEILLVLISVGLVVACGAFVAAEFSFVTVDRATVDRAAEQGDRGAAGVKAAIHTLSTQLSAAQVGITLTNLVIGFLAEPAIASLLDGPLEAVGISGNATSGISLVVAFILANAATMIYGELVPKNLAIAHPMGTARAVQGFQRGFTRVCGPLVRGANGLANLILHRIGIEPQEELASARSPEELESLVRRSGKKGTLERETAELLAKSLEFGEHRADDVMVPRVRVETLAPDDPVSAVVEATKRTGRSRFPVIEEGSEEVEGIVHVKHAVAVPHGRRDQVPVSDVMADPVLVPTSIELDPLLTELRKVGLQVAVVVDEFGGFDGIVTLEDLIEEIVGEVVDEHDEEDPPVRTIGTGIWGLSGLLRPDEIADETGIELPEDEDYETVAGLIGMELGRVPGQGDAIRIGAIREADFDPDEEPVAAREPVNVDLTVLKMDGLRVDRVRMDVWPVEEEEGP
ncbi:MAG: HlyC/CorC family transporter [Solirubrobacterales bacterium]|nr:HlyC/CorC family transporter [Solirubrobacterales bacterium]